MKLHRTGARKGFSLVELLAVVLILAVLAAVAVPLYLNTRKTSAARACKANINAIASAEAAYALRNGVYVSMASLVTASPEGLSGSVSCPLNGATYSLTTVGATDTSNNVPAGPGGTTAQIYIVCPNASAHAAVLSTTDLSPWQRPMSSIGADTQP